MSSNLINFLNISVVSIMVSACASVTGPGKQQVQIDSEPQGAEVFVDGRNVTTPAVVTLKGKSEYYIKASRPGYDDVSEKIDSEFRVLPVVLGNIVNFTGLIGVGVDVLGTGAAYDMDDKITISMRKKQPLVEGNGG